MKAVIGKFYKTKRLAEKSIKEYPEWIAERKVILGFKNGYLVVGKDQLKK